MPELPEVETIVRDIRPLLMEKRIETVEVGKLPLRRQWLAEWNKALVGRKIQEVRRRGKWIVVVLDSEGHLLIHLGMTGQIRIVPRAEPVLDHTHLTLPLNKGQEQLRFRDVRRFGSVTLFLSQQELEAFFQKAKLGPEPFDLPLDYFRHRLAKTNRCLKAVLLDQQVVAGVGNIYADESLFAARLHPSQTGKDTTAHQARRLLASIETVLTRAIEQRGSTIRNYIGGSGLKGQFQDEFSVYGREGKPCPKCRKKIERIRLAGRSTHFCPKCQKVVINH